MPIEIPCPGCSRLLRVPDGSEGKQARCPACLHTFPITASPSPVPAEAHAAARDGHSRNDQPDWFGPAESENPYQAPTHAETYAESIRTRGAQPLASRGTRLLGAILDGLIYIGAMLPGFLLLFVVVPDEPVAAVVGLLMVVGAMLAVAIVNWVMITNSGQSIAKRMLAMRIVGASDGLLPGFMRGVVIRSWLPMLINQLCSLFSLVDAVWIFGEERRCLHDLMADTIVIDARAVELSHGSGPPLREL